MNNEIVPCGKCVVCKRMTYDNKTNDGDPRGPIGLALHSPLFPVDFGYKGKSIPVCFGCMQERPRYNRAVALAEYQWIYKNIPKVSKELTRLK